MTKDLLYYLYACSRFLIYTFILVSLEEPRPLEDFLCCTVNEEVVSTVLSAL